MTRVIGALIILCAIVYLAVTLVDFFPKYGAVEDIVKHQDELGLKTTTTNLRFHMSLGMVVDIIVLGLLAVVAWWLIGSEVQQYAYAIVLGLLVVGSVTIRVTPVVPFPTARVSPAGAFFGTRVIVSVAADTTDGWVIIPKREQQRVVVTEVYSDTSMIGDKELVLDFSGNQSALRQYWSSQAPVSILGAVRGTRVLAVGKDLYTVPCVKVIEIQQAGSGQSAAGS